MLPAVVRVCLFAVVSVVSAFPVFFACKIAAISPLLSSLNNLFCAFLMTWRYELSWNCTVNNSWGQQVLDQHDGCESHVAPFATQQNDSIPLNTVDALNIASKPNTNHGNLQGFPCSLLAIFRASAVPTGNGVSMVP